MSRNILIIGDSISLGYTPWVKDALPCVTHVPVNARDTWFGLQNMDAWLTGTVYAIVYFNFGLWDIAHRCPTPDNQWNLCPAPSPFACPRATTPAEYKQNLSDLADLMRAKKPSATFIFATMTPVPDGADGRIPNDAVDYNIYAADVMESKGFIVDHLGQVMNGHDDLRINPTNVHYTAAGYQLLASHVIDTLNAHGGC